MSLKIMRMSLLLSLVLPVTTPAGGACFCLADADDNFRHSCETQQQGPREVAHCRDDDGKPYRVDDLSGWTTLPEGEGRCDPCKPLKTRTEGPIRGDEDNERTTGSIDEHAE